MNLLPMAIAAFGAKAQATLTGLASKAKIMGAIGVCAVVAVIFALVALTLFLAEEVGAIQACLIMSAIFAGVALVLFMLHHRGQRAVRLKEVERTARTGSVSTTRAAITLAEAFLKGFMGPKS